MRAWRALSDEGVQVTRTPAWVAWGSYGLMYASTSVFPVEDTDASRTATYVVAGVGYVGAYAAGLTQYLVNRRAMKGHLLPQVSVSPWYVREGSGLVLAGRF